MSHDKFNQSSDFSMVQVLIHLTSQEGISIAFDHAIFSSYYYLHYDLLEETRLQMGIFNDSEYLYQASMMVAVLNNIMSLLGYISNNYH